LDLDLGVQLKQSLLWSNTVTSKYSAFSAADTWVEQARSPVMRVLTHAFVLGRLLWRTPSTLVHVCNLLASRKGSVKQTFVRSTLTGLSLVAARAQVRGDRFSLGTHQAGEGDPDAHVDRQNGFWTLDLKEVDATPLRSARPALLERPGPPRPSGGIPTRACRG